MLSDGKPRRDAKRIPAAGEKRALASILFHKEQASFAGDGPNRGKRDAVKRAGQKLGFARWHGEQEFVVISPV